jgi:hypothetical protein
LAAVGDDDVSLNHLGLVQGDVGLPGGRGGQVDGAEARPTGELVQEDPDDRPQLLTSPGEDSPLVIEHLQRLRLVDHSTSSAEPWV